MLSQCWDSRIETQSYILSQKLDRLNLRSWLKCQIQKWWDSSHSCGFSVTIMFVKVKKFEIFYPNDEVYDIYKNSKINQKKWERLPKFDFSQIYESDFFFFVVGQNSTIKSNQHCKICPENMNYHLSFKLFNVWGFFWPKWASIIYASNLNTNTKTKWINK